MPPNPPSILVPGARAGSVREAWRLAWPTIVGQLALTAMWTADTMMLGRVGKVEMAAAGFGGVLIWTLYTFFVGLVTATNAFVSQASGRGDREEAAVFAWQGLWLSAGAAAILALAAWRFDWILALARPDPAVIAECLRYSRARMTAAFFAIATFTLQAFFRGIGDVKTPMRVAVVSNLLNIGLDAVLIFGLGPFPRLTTLGAGIATAASQLVGFALLAGRFLGPRLAAAWGTRRAWRFRLDATRRLLRVGLPLGAEHFGDMGSFSVFMALMGRLGTDELAASQIAIQVLSFSFMPVSGVARAATTLVGNYLGAGQPDLASRSGWTCIRLSAAYTLVAGGAMLAVGAPLFTVFNDDPGVVAAGLGILPMLAGFQVLDGAQMTAGGALQGAGDTAFPMALLLASSWLLFVPLAWFLSGAAGITGAWTAPLVHFGVVSAALLARFARGGWRHRRI